MPDSGSNMELIQLVFGIILFILIIFLILKFIYNRIRILNLPRNEVEFEGIRLIYSQLKKNKSLNLKRITRSAHDIEKRVFVYKALKQFNKIDLFPKELLTREKASESYLVNWLYHNEEYDIFPNGIKYCETVELEKNLIVMVFQFKSIDPHFLADKGWVYGYVTYNSLTNEPYCSPSFIMSDFDNHISGKEELKNKAQINNVKMGSNFSFD